MNIMIKDNDIYKRLRLEMVEKQLKARDISDERVLDAMRKVPRHLFMEEAFRDRAYGDFPLPIGESQTISQPYMVAIMSQLLELDGTEKVLEIGTGSGYQTAILSQLAGQVCSIERVEPLLKKARKLLERLKYQNVALKVADGTLGWKDYAPYKAIIVTAGGPDVPEPLIEQLEVGGRLVMPTGNEDKQLLQRIIKTPSGVRRSVLSPCSFVKLIGAYGW